MTFEKKFHFNLTEKDIKNAIAAYLNKEEGDRIGLITHNNVTLFKDCDNIVAKVDAELSGFSYEIEINDSGKCAS